MPGNYGVNTVISTDAARPMTIASTTPIGVVATVVQVVVEDKQMQYFGNTEAAQEAFKDIKGSLLEALDAMSDQGVACPVILSLVAIDEAQLSSAAEDFYDTPELKSKIIEAVDALKKAQALFGVKPNLLVAPRFSHDMDVAAALQGVAEKLKATALIDLNAGDEADALKKSQSFVSRRVLLIDPYVKVWDTQQNKAMTAPSSPRIAALIAKTDATWEYGWADSFSNRVVNGISGTSRAVDFVPGETCEADRLRTQAITSIVRYNGFRIWGGETTDVDPIWQDLTRVRIFDRVCEAALKGLFWAIDKRADELKAAKDSVEQLLLGLKGSAVLVDFEVQWDEAKNTKAAITAGKFYLIARLQNTPIVKRLEINFSYTDKFANTLIEQISQ